jgi:hypothetical protein
LLHNNQHNIADTRRRIVAIVVTSERKLLFA